MFVDAHTHLDHYLDHYLDSEVDAILDEIVQHDCRCWAVSTSINSWERTQRLAQPCPLILPTFNQNYQTLLGGA